MQILSMVSGQHLPRTVHSRRKSLLRRGTLMILQKETHDLSLFALSRFEIRAGATSAWTRKLKIATSRSSATVATVKLAINSFSCRRTMRFGTKRSVWIMPAAEKTYRRITRFTSWTAIRCRAIKCGSMPYVDDACGYKIRWVLS